MGIVLPNRDGRSESKSLYAEDRPLVWLGEKSADQPRLLPIAIGEFEAAAQMQLEQDEPIRPISYDLLSSMLTRA